MIDHYLTKLYGSILELELSVVAILYVPLDMQLESVLGNVLTAMGL